MRKIIISILGVLLLIATFWLLQRKNNESISTKEKTAVNAYVPVAVKKIKLTEASKTFFLTGRVIPKVKLDIALTIGGQILYNSGRFKPGVFFKKGELIITVDSSETLSKLKSQKSNFVKLLSTVVPDLSIDYPEIYDSWQIYLIHFDINGTLKPLPATITNQQRLFLSGRGVYASFYALEEVTARLQKHSIYAPFDGILTETFIDEGTIVSPNKPLGEFIFTGTYEIEASMPSHLISSLEKGTNYTFHILNKGDKKSINAQLIRINNKVDEKTQSIRVYFESKNENLIIGTSLSTRIVVEEFGKLALIPESSFVDEHHVFLAVEGKATLKKVKKIFKEDGKVATNSLLENDVLIIEKKPISFAQIPVKTIEAQ